MPEKDTVVVAPRPCAHCGMHHTAALVGCTAQDGARGCVLVCAQTSNDAILHDTSGASLIIAVCFLFLSSKVVLCVLLDVWCFAVFDFIAYRTQAHGRDGCGGPHSLLAPASTFWRVCILSFSFTTHQRVTASCTCTNMSCPLSAPQPILHTRSETMHAITQNHTAVRPPTPQPASPVPALSTLTLRSKLHV